MENVLKGYAQRKLKIVHETYGPIGEWDVSNVMGDGHARYVFQRKTVRWRHLEVGCDTGSG